MGWGSGRQPPGKDDDMLFSVAYVEDDEIKFIVKGPYSKVGPARSQVTASRRYKRPDTKGDYRLIATKVEWVVVE